jgi:hypothetical protein
MKYLPGDERRAGVLACQRFVTRFAHLTWDPTAKRVLNKAMENI